MRSSKRSTERTCQSRKHRCVQALTWLPHKLLQIREEGEQTLAELHKEIQTLQDQCDDEERTLESTLRAMKVTTAVTSASYSRGGQDRVKAEQEKLDASLERKKEEGSTALADLEKQVTVVDHSFN